MQSAWPEPVFFMRYSYGKLFSVISPSCLQPEGAGVGTPSHTKCTWKLEGIGFFSEWGQLGSKGKIRLLWRQKFLNNANNHILEVYDFPIGLYCGWYHSANYNTNLWEILKFGIIMVIIWTISIVQKFVAIAT